MKLGTKTLTAAVAAALLLFSAAAPASATPVSSEVTDGTLQTAIGNFDLDPTSGTHPCGSSSAVTSDIVGPDGSGNYSSAITALTVTSSFSVSGSAYILELTRDAAGTNTGTILANGTVVHSLRVFLDIYATTGTPPSCVKGTRVCRARLTFLAPTTPLVGIASPVPPTSTGDTTTLAGSSATVTGVFGFACNAPWASFIGTSMTFPAGDPLELTTL